MNPVSKSDKLIQWQRITIWTLLVGIVVTGSYAGYYHFTEITDNHCREYLEQERQVRITNERTIHDQDALLKRYKAKYGNFKWAPNPVIWTEVLFPESGRGYIGVPRKGFTESGIYKACQYKIRFGAADEANRSLYGSLIVVPENGDSKEIELAREYGDIGDIKDAVKRLQRRAEDDFPLLIDEEDK